MIFHGQVVIGPPGSGKTTYCYGMKMFIETLGRECCIINLDFANDKLPYECSIDVRELVSLERVMEELNLGPNGGLIYCMEYLLENFEWLEEKLQNLSCHYLIFDCPGQIELYTHHTCVHKIIQKLQVGVKSGKPNDLDCRLCSVHLVDSFYCSMPTTFISAVLLVVSTMMRLALPHVSVLSKVDLLQNYGKLPFNLDFYTDLPSLLPLTRYINGKMYDDQEKQKEVNDDYDDYDIDNGIDHDYDDYNNNDYDDYDNNDENIDNDNESNIVESKKSKKVLTPRELMDKKLKKMAEGLCEVLDDVGLISFIALNIQDGETVNRVLTAIDRANGYSFFAYEIQSKKPISDRSTKGNIPQSFDNGNQLMNLIDSGGIDSHETTYSRTIEIQERYTSNNG